MPNLRLVISPTIAVVRRVLESASPPRRVSAGKPGERMGLVAKRLLPFRVFEAAAKGSLGVDQRELTRACYESRTSVTSRELRREQ